MFDMCIKIKVVILGLQKNSNKQTVIKTVSNAGDF